MADYDLELGMLEHRLHQARQSAIQAELSAAGLQEIGHPMLLCILRGFSQQAPQQGPGGRIQAQRDLAELLNVSPAAVTTSLKSLERKGYIHREPEPSDARRNRVTLTEKGQRAVDDCFACLQRVTRRMYAGLTGEEQAAMQAIYLRMLENLQPPGGQGAPAK